jgi:hypothetical protein
MSNKLLLLSILFLFIIIQSNAQNLPDAWNISADGRMMTAGGENDEGFYSQNQMHDVELDFFESNWWQLLEDNYEDGTDILATCWIDGIQYDSVGVSFKGATSYFQNNTEKKSFNVNLDHIIDGQDVDGYNTFNLNCGWSDNSSMKEVLFNNIGQNYYMSLKANYVNLTLNGASWGPYQSVQQFDSDYIKEWYLSNDGTIWRAERTTSGGGGPGGPNFGAGSSTLNYNGPDSTDYNTDYTLKRTEQDDPWAGLIAACDVLDNEPLATLEQELSQVLDIDKACWHLAHEIVFADDDSYIFKGGMDYYVYYEAETNRIIPMEYDGNSVLANNHLNWDLFYNEDDTDFPLMNRMLAVPSIRQRYLAHVRVILEDYFNSTYADAKIDSWATLIDASVQADPKKFYTYNQFQNSIANLKQTIITRRNFLMSDAEMTNIESLTVDGVSFAVNGANWQSPSASDEVDVVVDVTGSVGTASVWLYYGEGFTGVFSKTEMYDDGLHNDGAALDGQFGAAIPTLTSGSYVRYYIEAIANDAASSATYEPKGAEHDVYIYQIQLETVADMPVVINELMADNTAATADSFGEFDDWLELYNVSSASVDLTGWTLTDDINELDKFTIPSGTILEPDSYLVVWADGDIDQGDLHADFKLSSNGETLYLLNSAQELVDEIEFPASTTDLAYARVPNGTGPFEYQGHTIAANNDIPTGLFESAQDLGFYIYPNPASDYITLDLGESNRSISNLQIVNLLGEVIYSNSENILTKNTIHIGGFAAGLYLLRLELDDAVVAMKFIKE